MREVQKRVSRVHSGDAETLGFCLGDCGRGRVEDQPLFVDIDAGFRIDRQCHVEGFDERGPDLPDTAIV